MNRDLMLLGSSLVALNLLAIGVWIGTSRLRLVLALHRKPARRAVPAAPPSPELPGCPSETRLAENIERWRNKRHGRVKESPRPDDGPAELASWIEEVESEEAAGGETLPRAAASCRAVGTVAGRGRSGFGTNRALRT